jgi:hypothetical protein
MSVEADQSVNRHSFGPRFAQRQVSTGTRGTQCSEVACGPVLSAESGGRGRGRGRGREGACGVHGAHGISTVVVLGQDPYVVVGLWGHWHVELDLRVGSKSLDVMLGDSCLAFALIIEQQNACYSHFIHNSHILTEVISVD